MANIDFIEWIDIVGSESGPPGLMKRLTLGVVLSTTHVSEGQECTILARTLDENGWSEYVTIPNGVIAQRFTVCGNFGQESELSSLLQKLWPSS